MKKNIKILKVGKGAGINIPKVVLELLELKPGDSVNFEYDVKKKVITLKK